MKEGDGKLNNSNRQISFAVILSITVLIFLAVVVGYYLTNYTIDTPNPQAPATISAVCASDSDCVLYGEDGMCTAGCYHIDDLPTDSGGECFNAAPKACRCDNGMCVGYDPAAELMTNPEGETDGDVVFCEDAFTQGRQIVGADYMIPCIEHTDCTEEAIIESCGANGYFRNQCTYELYCGDEGYCMMKCTETEIPEAEVVE